MRDPDRLNELYLTLLDYHQDLFPDLRFFQFIDIFQDFSHRKGIDAYFLEEDRVISYLHDFVESKGK